MRRPLLRFYAFWVCIISTFTVINILVSLYLPPECASLFPCSEVSPYARSAVKRATSDACKSEMAQVACKNEDKNLHPSKLPNFCKDVLGNREDAPQGDKKEMVRIVYILTLSGRSVRQVRRLFNAIFDTRNFFLIHVDSRDEFMQREIQVLEEQFPANVRMVRRRYATIWGGTSLLQMLLQSLKELMEQTEWQWDFVLNLSETDYPLKRPDKLVAFLTKHRGKNFLKSHGRSSVDDFVRRQKLDHTFYECDQHLWKIGQRSPPSGIQIDGGSDWFCLHRTFVEYLVSSEDKLVSGLKEYFRYALLPAESFFHTVLKNSRFCHTVVNNNLRLTNWRRKQGCRCQHRAVVDACGCNPNEFTINESKKLLSTTEKDIFFGRKFSPRRPSIIDFVDNRLLRIDWSGAKGRTSYWENLYHHQDNVAQIKPEKLLLAYAMAKQYLERFNHR